MFEIIKLDLKVIEDIEKILSTNKFMDYSKDTCTVKGFQTDNIINIFSTNLLKQMLPYLDFSERVFHIHYINYYNEGYQKKHNHAETEKFSFILYLNDADGDTVFEDPIKKNIKPQKGILILFDSSIWHYGKMTSNNKRVLVGAIDKCF